MDSFAVDELKPSYMRGSGPVPEDAVSELFGRVSSGKSSLLNALLNTDVLPVGINPITAVPTKLRYGPELRAAVAFGDGQSAIVSVDELAKLVTEQSNPGNRRNVVRAIVEVPSPRLREGIMLVDTPGLGSLTKRGAAETLASLPSCDLALLLIDAGAILSAEDIGTLRLLYKVGIPALVLLSKAGPACGRRSASDDFLHRRTYQERSRSPRNNSPHQRVESLLNPAGPLFERELFPRFEEARALRNASVARKSGSLREAVTSAMESSLHREERDDLRTRVDSSELEALLRVVTGEVGEQRTVLDYAFRTIGETPDAVLNAVAQEVVTWSCATSESRISPLRLFEWIHDVITRSVQPPIDRLREVGQHAI